MSIAYNSSIVRDGLVLNLDAGNVKSYSVNVHPYPTDIGRWATSGNNATFTRDTSVTDSPVKGIPLKMAITGTDPYTSTYSNSIWNLAPAVSGQTWTASVYVKASAVTEGTIFLFEANSSGSYTALSTNVVPITTSWTRISVTRTFNNGTTAYVQVRLDGPDSGGSGINIWWDGLQVERSATASDFTSRTNTNGNTWADLSGNGNNGSLANYPTYGTNALTFNGSNSNAIVANSASLKNNTITIDCWLKNNGTISGDIIQFGVGSGSYAQYYLRSYGGNTYWDWFPTNSAAYGEAALANSNFTVGEWKNLVLTGSYNSVVQMFLNTVSVGGPVTTSTTALSTWTPADLTIGGFAWDGFTTLSIGSVKIYNRVLSTTEIAQNFEACRGRFGI